MVVSFVEFERKFRTSMGSTEIRVLERYWISFYEKLSFFEYFAAEFLNNVPKKGPQAALLPIGAFLKLSVQVFLGVGIVYPAAVRLKEPSVVPVAHQAQRIVGLRRLGGRRCRRRR